LCIVDTCYIRIKSHSFKFMNKSLRLPLLKYYDCNYNPSKLSIAIYTHKHTNENVLHKNICLEFQVLFQTCISLFSNFYDHIVIFMHITPCLAFMNGACSEKNMWRLI
jgi:hypothetical protein